MYADAGNTSPPPTYPGAPWERCRPNAGAVHKPRQQHHRVQQHSCLSHVARCLALTSVTRGFIDAGKGAPEGDRCGVGCSAQQSSAPGPYWGRSWLITGQHCKLCARGAKAVSPHLPESSCNGRSTAFQHLLSSRALAKFELPECFCHIFVALTSTLWLLQPRSPVGRAPET